MPVAVISHGDRRVSQALLDHLRRQVPVDAPACVEMPEDVHPSVFGLAVLVGDASRDHRGDQAALKGVGKVLDRADLVREPQYETSANVSRKTRA